MTDPFLATDNARTPRPGRSNAILLHIISHCFSKCNMFSTVGANFYMSKLMKIYK